VAVKEILSCFQQGVHIFKEFTVRDFATKMAPEHFNRVEPGAIGGQVQQHQASSRCTHDSFDFIVFMGTSVVPGDVDRAREMFVHQGLQKFGRFSASLPAAKQDHGLTGVVVDGTQTIALVGLARRRDLDLLTKRAPHRTQRGQPTDVEFIGVVEDIP
jgi:hypothetical protein